VQLDFHRMQVEMHVLSETDQECKWLLYASLLGEMI